MSEYLTRLAAGVRMRRSPIHALTRPLFANSADEPAVIEEEQAAPRARMADLREVRAEPQPASNPHRDTTRNSDAVPIPGELPEEAPALPERTASTEASNQSLLPEIAVDLPAPQSRSETTKPPVPASYRPLVVMDVHEAAPLPNVPAEPRRSQPAFRTTAAAREPDEIQIHIGRIEVTAAPPPAPSRAAKPARKSVSLDEYLKRGRR